MAEVGGGRSDDANEAISLDDSLQQQNERSETRAKYIFSKFNKLANPHRYVCQYVADKNLDGLLVFCGRIFQTTKSTGLYAHLRTHNDKLINKELDRFNQEMKEKSQKKSELHNKSLQCQRKRV